MPVETALLVYQGRPAAVCDYEEFTEDIALNRVIRAAAERVASSPLVPFALRRRAKAILARLGDVGPLETRDLGVRLDRLTQRYQHALVFAKQLLGIGGVELGHGDTAGWAFLIRTPELMEAGIRTTLQRRLAPEWRVEKRGRTIQGRGVAFNPDLVFGLDEVIGDVKYRSVTSDWARGDLYQIVTFATAFQCRAACMIGFQSDPLSALPADLEVGTVVVRCFGWQTALAPVQAEEHLVQELRPWLDLRRSSALLIA
jgi:5-methylcytosine-specific restriction enzyme subunit McrC